jgi:hypothetical protein
MWFFCFKSPFSYEMFNKLFQFFCEYFIFQYGIFKLKLFLDKLHVLLLPLYYDIYIIIYACK